MPWVLEETFAAAGLDLHSEVTLRRLDPFYRIFWAGEDRHLDFVQGREAMADEIARFSTKDAAAFGPFMDALRPIYEDGIVGAGRRPFLNPVDLARFVPKMVRMGAAVPLWRMVAKHFEHPRIREAFSFHSLFIGGDPFRVPAIYGALVYLQFLDGVWYPDGATSEPFLAVVLIAFPWVLGYDDSDAATTVSVAAGVVVLLVGMSTRWRQSLVKLIPQRTHGMLDIGLGVLLVLLPFVLGYTEETGATVFHVVMGLGFVAAGALTNWDADDRAHVGAADARRF